MYEYRVDEVIKIYDGDTITVKIDLGFSITKKEKIRLSRINTPEIRGEERPEGLVSRDWLRNRINSAIENNVDIIIKTNKDIKGKYGRYIGDVFISDICINDELVSLGLAEYKEY